MCSLYSINNSSRFAGQSSFQVVLCAKGPDNNTQRGPLSSSCPSSVSSSFGPVSPGRNKKMKGNRAPVLVVSQQSTQDHQAGHGLFHPPSFQTHSRVQSYPRSPPQQQHHQQQQRRRHGSSAGTSHWHQFHQHQHHQYHPFHQDHQWEHHTHHQHQPDRILSTPPSHNPRNLPSSTIPTSTSNHSRPLPPTSQSIPAPSISPSTTDVSTPDPKAEPAEPAVAMAATIAPSALTVPFFMPSENQCASSEALLSGSLTTSGLVPMAGEGQHPLDQTLGVTPAQLMVLPGSPSTVEDEAVMPMAMATGPQEDTRHVNGVKVEVDRKSRRKQTIQRLQAKNRTLKSSLAQAKADLAAERQRRSTVDRIYLQIKNDLNRKLEAEEFKVCNLRAELEQMTADMKELKDQVSTNPASTYRIGYDNTSFSLAGGGLMMHHSNLMDQDDSEEFFFNHSYSPLTHTTESFQAACTTSTTMLCDDLEEDAAGFGDAEGGASDEEEGPYRMGGFHGSQSAKQSSLPTLMEADEDETEEAPDDEDEGDSPCTMMEILLKRQRSHSPEDEAEDPPADQDETFESMAHKCLIQAIQSKFTTAQAHLQLDELVSKYEAMPETTVMVVVQELMKWWETERSLAASTTVGSHGVQTRSSQQQVPSNTKLAIESQFQSFFAPLLLHYVASHEEQMLLLEVLGKEARMNLQWLRNHNAQLMALYKFDVVEADAILEWWGLLQEPEGVFGHRDNLRSLNSRFVAWLEDDEDSSDDSDSDSDSDYEDDEDEEDEEEEEGDEDEAWDSDLDMESVDSGAHVGSEEENDEDKALASTNGGQQGKGLARPELRRRISFSANHVLILQDGRQCTKAVTALEKDMAAKKAYDQCPAMRDSDTEEEEEGEEEEDEEVEDDLEKAEEVGRTLVDVIEVK